MTWHVLDSDENSCPELTAFGEYTARFRQCFDYYTRYADLSLG